MANLIYPSIAEIWRAAHLSVLDRADVRAALGDEMTDAQLRVVQNAGILATGASQILEPGIYIAAVRQDAPPDFAIDLTANDHLNKFRMGRVSVDPDSQPENLGRFVAGPNGVGVIVIPAAPTVPMDQMAGLMAHEARRAIERQQRPYPRAEAEYRIARDAAAYEASSTVLDVCNDGLLSRCTDATIANGGRDVLRQGRMLVPDYRTRAIMERFPILRSATLGMMINNIHDYHGEMPAPAEVVDDYVSIMVDTVEVAP